MAFIGQLVLLLPGDAVFLGDVLRREAHVVGVEDFPQAVVDHEVRHLAEGHVHAVPPAGVGKAVRDVAHVFHAAGDDDVAVAALDDLGGQRDGLHPRGADLLDGDDVRLLGKPGVDGRLPGGVLALAGGEDVSEDDLVEVDGGQGRIIIITLFLNFRHIKFAENLGTGGLDEIIDGRAEPGPLDGLFHAEPSHLDDGNTLQGTAEFADGGSCSTYDNDILHTQLLLSSL